VSALTSRGIERVWLWRRGVDTVRFDPRHRSARLRQTLAPNGERLVGYVGRLAPEKRLDLLGGVARLPGVQLVIVGDGPARSRLERTLPRAAFLGVRHGSQLATLYASLDLFVHTGPYETFGQAIQEALASGLPVVAPAAGGPLDLIEHGRTGLLVPPEDAAAVTCAVADIAGCPRRLATFGGAARTSVAGRSWDTICDELLGHYSAVMGLTTGQTPEVCLPARSGPTVRPSRLTTAR
jgi:phosphatidylinositol alpha 1,6-mannosyltransferase